jgi:hypothetical protein
MTTVTIFKLADVGTAETELLILDQGLLLR